MLPLVKVGLPPAAKLMPELEKVLYSGQIAEGQQVYDFEAKFRDHFGLPHIVAMSSGTAALHAALVLSGVQPGDEVISTSMTAEPTNTSILYVGAKIVWADVDPASGNIDPDSIRAKITHKTKAIVVVHYAGYPARMNEIQAISREYGLKLIEDCAHALGATYANRSVGVMGDFGIFSFQAIKHMPIGDGGALVISNPELLQAARKFRWFGMLKGVSRTEVDINSLGYKYNMNNINATIGLVQLRVINDVVQRHISNGKYYDSELKKIPGLAFARCDLDGNPSYWLYTLLSDRAPDVERALNAAGITASKLHRPNHLHTIFENSRVSLPGTDLFYRRLLHIPVGWWVSDEDREKIVSVIKKG